MIRMYLSPLLTILMRWLPILHLIAGCQPNDTSECHVNRLSRDPARQLHNYLTVDAHALNP